MHYNTKTIARLAAVQAMYLMAGDSTLSTSDAIDHIIEYYKSDSIAEDYELPEHTKLKPHRGHVTALVTHTNDFIAMADQMIQAHLDMSTKHAITTLSLTLLTLLRVGTTELKFFPETSHKIIINEYTNIAGMLLKDQDISFVNSCLDFVYKQQLVSQ